MPKITDVAAEETNRTQAAKPPEDCGYCRRRGGPCSRHGGERSGVYTPKKSLAKAAVKLPGGEPITQSLPSPKCGHCGAKPFDAHARHCPQFMEAEKIPHLDPETMVAGGMGWAQVKLKDPNATNHPLPGRDDDGKSERVPEIEVDPPAPERQDIPTVDQLGALQLAERHVESTSAAPLTPENIEVSRSHEVVIRVGDVVITIRPLEPTC